MKKLVILIAIAIIGGVQIGLAQKKQSSTYNFERAKELVQQKGNPEEILELLDKQLKETLKYADALFLRAGIYVMQKNFDRALADVNRAIACFKRKNADYSKSRLNSFRAYVYAEYLDEPDKAETISEIQIRKMYSGVYEVPCTINGLPLKFIFDTGASTVTISSVEASFMLKNGYLKEADIKGKEYYSTATGEIHEGTTIRLREIKIGDSVLRNVEASVTHHQQAPLLLGQSVLERFGTITIDNINSKLIINQK